MPYAEGTGVSPERSRNELERLLKKHDAKGVMYGYDQQRAVVKFLLANRQVQFEIPIPARSELTHTKMGKRRTAIQLDAAVEQVERQRWRALLLVIKAKLESVESGIVGFDAEFAAFILLPDGRTAGEHIVPAIEEAYRTNTMPQLLPTAKSLGA